MKNLLNRTIINSDVLDGKPSIRGKRIFVQTILEFLSAGTSRKKILHQYPSLEPSDIDACLQYAAKVSGLHYPTQPVSYV